MGVKRSQLTKESAAAYDKWVRGGRVGPRPELIKREPLAPVPAYLPDGREILPAPSVPISEAASMLGVTEAEIRRLASRGKLRADATGERISVPSLRLESRRRKIRNEKDGAPRRFVVAEAEEREDLEIARRIEAMEKAHARRPAKGYMQPKDGLSSRPATGGLPTLGRRR